MSEQAKQELRDQPPMVGELQGKLAATEAARERIRVEREIDAALLMNGAADLETARLLVEQRLNSQSATHEQVDVTARVKAAVAEVRKRKPYLFPEERSGITRGANGVAKPNPPVESDVEKAAARAMQSGDRRSVTDYMRLKRGAG